MKLSDTALLTITRSGFLKPKIKREKTADDVTDRLQDIVEGRATYNVKYGTDQTSAGEQPMSEKLSSVQMPADIQIKQEKDVQQETYEQETVKQSVETDQPFDKSALSPATCVKKKDSGDQHPTGLQTKDYSKTKTSTPRTTFLVMPEINIEPVDSDPEEPDELHIEPYRVERDVMETDMSDRSTSKKRLQTTHLDHAPGSDRAKETLKNILVTTSNDKSTVALAHTTSRSGFRDTNAVSDLRIKLIKDTTMSSAKAPESKSKHKDRIVEEIDSNKG